MEFNLPKLDHRFVGIVLIILSIFLFLLINYYTKNLLAVNAELHKGCNLPEEVCPFKRSIPFESYVGYSLSGIVGLLGLFLSFSKVETEKIPTKERLKLRQTVKSLQGDEQKIYKMIVDADGSIFQNDLVTKTGYSKVKVSRILDRLEAKGIVERRRRGMANIVLTKYGG